MVSKLTLSFDAIGTGWVIDIYDDVVKGENLENEVLQIISKFSKVFSRFDPTSEVSKASASSYIISIPNQYKKLINLYFDLYKLTYGKFTPLIGNLLEDAGYNKDYSLKSGTLRAVLKWEEVIFWNNKELEIKTPVTLDFGAAGKGFLVDLIGKFLESEGIINYCIDAGGDILYRTTTDTKLKVGLENPDNSSQAIGICTIKNQSICGSSGNRRKWDKYNHIFDPDKLESVEKIKAVWVISDEAYIADGLSTALFLKDPETFKSVYNFEYLIIYKDNQFKKSINFPGEVFTKTQVME